MKKMFTVPTTLTNFEVKEDKRTTATLNVFYVGETPDGRIFTQEFSDDLIKSLPGTPVVAYFDKEQDDFVGHNSTQYAYGFVDSNAEIKYTKDEDGKKWAVTSVTLHTDRLDNIGEIAKKIVGKRQSLELDPVDVAYELFKEDGKQKIKFTKARFFGLSVLGDSQNPAFTGSGFFTENFTSIDLKNRFSRFCDHLEENSRGEEMDLRLKVFTDFFIPSESYKTIAETVQKGFDASGKNIYVVDLSDTEVVGIEFTQEGSRLVRYSYVIGEDSTVTFDNEVEVYTAYLTTEELSRVKATPTFKEVVVEDDLQQKDNLEQEVGPADNPHDLTAADINKDATVETETAAGDVEVTETVKIDAEVVIDATAQVEEIRNEQNNATEAKFSLPASSEAETENEKTVSVTTFSEEERRELEELRTEKKERLIASYTEDVSADFIAGLDIKVFSYDALESKLAIQCVKEQKAKKAGTPLSFKDLGTAKDRDAVKVGERSVSQIIAAYTRNGGE